MNATVTIRDLRNHGGDVLARVQRGETITITSSGTPVAELHPLPARPLTVGELIAQRAAWGMPLDPARLRADIDAVIDQTI
jgi:prevent-host-death family protein